MWPCCAECSLESMGTVMDPITSHQARSPGRYPPGGPDRSSPSRFSAAYILCIGSPITV